MRKAALHNLGCKVNGYEMDVMQQILQEKGYKIVSFDEKADIYIINTCTVTNIADQKSRQMLHRARKKNPEAVVVAVGCYVQTGEEKIAEDMAVDLVIGNNRKKDVAEILEAYLAERKRGTLPEEDRTLRSRTVIDINHTKEYEEMKLTKTAEHTRAYIKIQDGCNQFCSYCIIPYARGRVRSRRPEAVCREAMALADTGCREIVLTGIHLSSYGMDLVEKRSGEGPGETAYKEECLLRLIEKLHEIKGIERIRLGSLEPRIVTERFAERLSGLAKVCPHFHLSLQSGCDATLKRMNRRYTTGEYYKSVEALREAFHEPAITTDVIVGFPGETEEEFARTKEFLEKVRFYEMHVFKYSRRAGTAAASMPDQVPEPMKAQRSGQLLDMEKQQSEAFRRRYIGRTVEVLLEEERRMEGRTYCIGHTKDYVKVAVDTTERTEKDGIAINGLAEVRVRGFLTDEILM